MRDMSKEVVVLNSIFQLEIERVEDDRSHVVIKIGDDVLESKQALSAKEVVELQKHIDFCNQILKRK